VWSAETNLQEEYIVHIQPDNKETEALQYQYHIWVQDQREPSTKGIRIEASVLI